MCDTNTDQKQLINSFVENIDKAQTFEGLLTLIEYVHLYFTSGTYHPEFNYVIEKRKTKENTRKFSEILNELRRNITNENDKKMFIYLILYTLNDIVRFSERGGPQNFYKEFEAKMEQRIKQYLLPITRRDDIRLNIIKIILSIIGVNLKFATFIRGPVISIAPVLQVVGSVISKTKDIIMTPFRLLPKSARVESAISRRRLY